MEKIIKRPLISVVIPMYNAEKYIEKCLESVITQSFDAYEVIVVDDGSKDSSPKIADQFAEQYNNLKVIHQENAGVIRARKTGVNNSCGEYILSLDSDDWLLDGHLSSIAEEIYNNKPDIVVTGYLEDNNGIQKKFYQNIKPGFYSGNEMKTEILTNFISANKFFSFGIYPTLWTSCIKKNLIIKAQENLPETYSIGEDISVTYPCIIAATSISILSIHSYVYRIQPESMTHVFDVNFSEKIIYLLNYLEKVLPQEITSNNQFCDYIVFETCLLVSSYLGLGLKEYSYREIICNIKKAIDHPIIRDTLNRFDLIHKEMSFKHRIKIFLIKKHWFRLYSFLV